MKNHRSAWALWFLSATAITVSACGGMGAVEPSNAPSAGDSPTPSTSGTASTGGPVGAGTTSSGGPTGSSPSGAGGATFSSPPPALVPAGAPTAMVGESSDSTATKGTPPTTPPATVPTGTTQPGAQLTAGTWDDNLNFDFYLGYLSNTAASQLQGLPLIDRSARMSILVKTADGQPVAGAQVGVVDSAGHSFSSITGAEGRVLFFPGLSGVAAGAPVTITAVAAEGTASQASNATAGTVELSLTTTTRSAVTGLDLAFVIDTTGSMGDELSYVQTELDNIVSGIAAQFPNVAQHWALVVYRDTGDLYVVRSFDFSSDLASFRQTLAAQASDGGNDTPEAVDQGLAAATQLSWRGGAVARLAFWIADAPHHVGRETAVVSALAAATAKGVHLYPVAASGIDDLGEYTMRTAAEVTGGRYLFLTNDSGIGGDHQEPHIPCYYVTTLASAMQRMVATEVTGTYVAPAAAEILRTGGDPQSQQCTLTDGRVVTAW